MEVKIGYEIQNCKMLIFYCKQHASTATYILVKPHKAFAALLHQAGYS